MLRGKISSFQIGQHLFQQNIGQKHLLIRGCQSFWCVLFTDYTHLYIYVLCLSMKCNKCIRKIQKTAWKINIYVRWGWKWKGNINSCVWQQCLIRHRESICVFVYLCICICVFLYLCIRIFVYLYLCIWILAAVCTIHRLYIYMYIDTYIYVLCLSMKCKKCITKIQKTAWKINIYM